MSRHLSVVVAGSLSLLAIAPAARVARAQDETLFHGGASAIGFYAAPVVKLTELHGQGEVLGGIRAGLLFGRRFGVGLAAYGGGGGMGHGHGSPLDQSFRPMALPGDFVPGQGISYGGLELEYLVLPAKLVHASIGTLIGGGTRQGDHRDQLHDGSYGMQGGYGHGGFFVAEPNGTAEVNLAKHVRLAMGVGYRFTAGGNDRGSMGNAGGVTGSLGLKLGKL